MPKTYALRATWAAGLLDEKFWGRAAPPGGQASTASPDGLEFGFGQGIEHVGDIAERHLAAQADRAGRPGQARRDGLKGHPGANFVDDQAPLEEAELPQLSLHPPEESAQAFLARGER